MSKLNETKPNYEELPRSGSVIYNFNYQDPLSKKKNLNRWRKLNKYLVVPLYRVKLLPLLGFGKIFLILKTKGWKTGKTRRTPLEYRRYEGKIIVFAARGENATWVKNIRSNPNNVSVIRGFNNFKTRLEFISDLNRKLAIIKWYVTNFTKAAKLLFGWDPSKDNPETTDFSKLINILSIILLHKEDN